MEYFDLKTIFSKEDREILDKDDNELTEKEQYFKEVFGEVVKDTDNKIPKEIGEMIIRENNNPNYTLLIHRTRAKNKNDIFKNGLINETGDDLEQTTSRYDDMEMIISIRDAYAYKSVYGENASCVLLKIPNTALKYTKGETKPILYQTDEPACDAGIFVAGKHKTVILPEYVLGSINFDGNTMTEFESNPNYKDVHDYQNDGLVCPSETIDSYEEQNPNDKKINQIKNNIIKDLKKRNFENEFAKQIKFTTESNIKISEYVNSEIIKENDKYMVKDSLNRTESELKSYSKKDMLLSKFNETVNKIKKFFTRDKTKEESKEDVDREQ